MLPEGVVHSQLILLMVNDMSPCLFLWLLSSSSSFSFSLSLFLRLIFFFFFFFYCLTLCNWRFGDWDCSAVIGVIIIFGIPRRCRTTEGRACHCFLPSCDNDFLSCVLHAKDDNVTVMLGAVIVGYDDLRNGPGHVLIIRS